MISSVLASALESAVRSLLVAGLVWAGLRAFRIRSVFVQKTVWGLVLATAALMPFLLRLAARWPELPIGATVVLPHSSLNLLAAESPSQTVDIPPAKASYGPISAPALPDAAMSNVSAEPEPASGASNSIPDSVVAGSPGLERIPPAKAQPLAVQERPFSILELAWLLYLSMTAGLLVRLLYGLASALRLWRNAEPVFIDALHGRDGLRLRSSRAVASPVTIGSGIVLPADHVKWDAEKLRIVLAHERSHIRQGDFYLQLLAGLYAVVFWFSPLGWWLKRQLSDLAEAISDRAGLCEAASRSSYAQVLLEFAARPRPTPIGVAMARSGSLSRRIDWLLDDSAFQQAFAASRLRLVAAVLLVPVALFAATSFIRVQAAAQTPLQVTSPAQAVPAAQPAPAPQPAAPLTGQARPEPDVQSVAIPAPNPVPAQTAPIAPVSPVGPLGPGDHVIVIPKIPRQVIVMPNLPRQIVVPEIPAMKIRVPDTARLMALAQELQATPGLHSARDISSKGWSQSGYFDNGDFYAVVTGNWDHLACCAYLESRRAEFEKIRKQAHGDFLWFSREGKSYFVDDPATLARIEAIYQQMQELRKRQAMLGAQQEALGRKQEALGQRQEQTTVTAPDISKEIAELNTALARLQAMQGKAITQQELLDLQVRLGEMQARLGMMQGQIGGGMGSLGAQQGKLGEEMGMLGSEQGRLGVQQRMLSLKADLAEKTIIDASLRNGTAHPVQ